jgi:hypothetical protein
MAGKLEAKVAVVTGQPAAGPSVVDMACSCINPRFADLRELADETFVVLEFDRTVAAADGCRDRRTF